MFGRSRKKNLFQFRSEFSGKALQIHQNIRKIIVVFSEIRRVLYFSENLAIRKSTHLSNNSCTFRNLTLK